MRKYFLAIFCILFLERVGFSFVMPFHFDAFFGSERCSDTISIGLDAAGTSRFDPYLDIPTPPSPPVPVDLFVYFPLDDPRFPFIRALEVDYRNMSSSVVSWTARIEGYGADSIFVGWDRASPLLLEPAQLFVGKAPRTIFPETLYNAALMDRLLISPWEELRIIFLRESSESLFGVIKGEFNRAFPETIRVYAYDPKVRFDPVEIPSCTVFSSGGFEFHLLPADYLLIFVSRTSWLSSSTQKIVGATFFRIAPGDTFELELEPLYPSSHRYEIFGRVVDRSGRPVSFALVFAEGARINNPNALCRFTIADDNGDFRLKDLNDQGVIIWAYQAGYVPRYLRGGIHWVSACTLFPATIRDDIRIELSQADTSGRFGIYGKIVGPSGLSEPISGARVYAINASSETLSAAIASYNGEFMLRNLREGVYTVCIDAYRYEYFCSPLSFPLDEFHPFYDFGVISLARSTLVEEFEKNYSVGLRAYPNPFNTELTIELDNGGLGSNISIYDINGRTVKKLVLGGLAKYKWDGKDENGQDLPSGIYFVRSENYSVNVVRVILLH